MKKTTFTKFLAVMLVLVTMFCICSVSASAATWRTGRFDIGYTAKGYTTVRLSNPNKNGYIRIYTYEQFGHQTSGKIHVTMRTTSGRWLCEFNTSSGTKLKLGNDNSAYRVYIARRSYPNTICGKSDAFINDGKCVYWGINCVSNCYI